ncbi:basic helix-loop-helix (bHLH) DNA-bindingsuperfamily protein, partial [Striga asiatica]
MITYHGCIENNIMAVCEDADGLRIILSIMIRKEGSTLGRTCMVYVSLENHQMFRKRAVGKSHYLFQCSSELNEKHKRILTIVGTLRGRRTTFQFSRGSCITTCRDTATLCLVMFWENSYPRENLDRVEFCMTLSSALLLNVCPIATYH